MSRLDEMMSDVESCMTGAAGLKLIIENLRCLAEANIEQASEIGTATIQHLNGEVCDKADSVTETIETLQRQLSELAHLVQNAGG